MNQKTTTDKNRNDKFTAVKPLFATVGATDAVYTAVLDAVTQVRERAIDVNGQVDEARERFATLPADVQTQFGQIRTRLSELPAELPDDLAELREKLTSEELRKFADQYYRQALDLYSELAVRGEQTVERLRSNHTVDEQVGRVETFYKDASSRAEEVFDRVSGLIGRGVKDTGSGAAPAESDVLEAEVVEVVPEPAPKPAPKPEPKPTPKAATEPAPESGSAAEAPAAKKSPTKKAPAKKTPPKKA